MVVGELHSIHLYAVGFFRHFQFLPLDSLSRISISILQISRRRVPTVVR